MTTTRSACYSKFRKHCKGTYRSGLEESVSDFLLAHKIDGRYEQQYLTYRVPESIHRYTPDFVLPNGIIIETKYGMLQIGKSIYSSESSILSWTFALCLPVVNPDYIRAVKLLMVLSVKNTVLSMPISRFH